MRPAKMDTSCKRACWGLAAALGVILLLIIWAFGAGFLKSLVWGVVAAILLGVILTNWLCGKLPASSSGLAGPASAPTNPVAPPPAASPMAPVTAPEVAAAKQAEETAEAPRAEAEPASQPSGGSAERRPEALRAPQDGKADDLKKIKGIGPKLEALCNSLGIYHYSQIAGWTEDEVAWMDENLEGFKGRVTRDEWVPQARRLAGPGTPDASGSNSKGEV